MIITTLRLDHQLTMPLRAARAVGMNLPHAALPRIELGAGSRVSAVAKGKFQQNVWPVCVSRQRGVAHVSTVPKSSQ
jgi:hypothetical protein